MISLRPMNKLSIDSYNDLIKKAIEHFWNTRNNQLKGRSKADQGNRSAVNGFPQTQPPWVGYLILVERTHKSSLDKLSFSNQMKD